MYFKQCGTEVDGNYSPECGNLIKKPKIKGKHILYNTYDHPIMIKANILINVLIL